MDDRHNSIFREYYTEMPFIDRYLTDPDSAIDVVIPVIHTNELWQANLQSFYREIPIARLLIADGGCVDDSIEIAKRFPRVTVLDHRSCKSLGYSIRKLIEAVTAEWFVYVHSDAYLPAGWFNAMQKYQATYDWFGCQMQHTIMVQYELDYGLRPWAGSQMGRRAAFDGNLQRIDDDYVYRQEDFVFSEIVKQGGFTEGKVTDTFHYHQTMRKPSPWSRKVMSVQIDVEMSREEEVRTWSMQANGIVKYLRPDGKWVIKDAVESVGRLIELGETTWPKYAAWVRTTNPVWLSFLRVGLMKRRALRVLQHIGRTVRAIFSP